jgi:hypothetical protein
MEPRIAKITTGFLAGNLPDDVNPACYAEHLRAYLEARYPGTEVEVAWENNASGSTPRPLQSHIYYRDDDDYSSEDIRDLEDVIEAHADEYLMSDEAYDTADAVVVHHVSGDCWGGIVGQGGSLSHAYGPLRWPAEGLTLGEVRAILDNQLGDVLEETATWLDAEIDAGRAHVIEGR